MVPLSALALPRFLHSALVAAGFTSLDDLDGTDAHELARDLKISDDVAADILRQADYRRGERVPLVVYRAWLMMRSGTVLVETEVSAPRIAIPIRRIAPPPRNPRTTGRRVVVAGRNDILVHGKPRDRPPALPAAVPPAHERRRTEGRRPARDGARDRVPAGHRQDRAPPSRRHERAHIPASTGSLTRASHHQPLVSRADENEQVDTEGGLSPPKLGRAASPFPAHVLDGIHLVRPLTQTEMIAFWYTLEDWLIAHPKARLIPPSPVLQDRADRRARRSSSSASTRSPFSSATRRSSWPPSAVCWTCQSARSVHV